MKWSQACKLLGGISVCLLVFLGCNGGEPAEDVSGDMAESGNATTRPAAQPSTRPTDSDDEGIPLDKLTGTWRATNVDASMGTVDITLEFRDNGQVHIEATSDVPLVGQVRDKTRSFELREGKVYSSDLRGGTTMPLSFENEDTLILEYQPGQRVKFHRIGEEDASGPVS